MLLGTLRFILQCSQSAAEADSRIFWRFWLQLFLCFAFCSLLCITISATAPLPIRLLECKCPNLFVDNFLTSWCRSRLRQKEKKFQYTHQYCIFWWERKRTVILLKPHFDLACAKGTYTVWNSELHFAGRSDLLLQKWSKFILLIRVWYKFGQPKLPVLSTRHIHGLHDNSCPTRPLSWCSDLNSAAALQPPTSGLRLSCNPIN